MMLNTKSRYAVMAMVELVKSGSPEAPMTLAWLAGQQEITVPYLEQIFCKLRKGGLVRSVKGPGGGYVLQRPAVEICIADIIRAVEEPIKITRCENHKDSGCMSKNAKCLTHELWEGLEMQIEHYLSAVTLQDVCERKAMGKAVHAMPPLREAGARI